MLIRYDSEKMVQGIEFYNSDNQQICLVGSEYGPEDYHGPEIFEYFEVHLRKGERVVGILYRNLKYPTFIMVSPI